MSKNRTKPTLEEQRIMRAEACVQKCGDKEALVLFRLMRETGIRIGDLIELTPQSLRDREVFLVERKYGVGKFYQYGDSSFPMVSEETAGMLVVGEDGKFFHHNKLYFISLFERVITEPGFNYHQLRRYVLEEKIEQSIYEN